MHDQLVRLMTNDGAIRASAANTTNLVGQICKLQHTDPTASVTLGRVTTAVCLMGGLLKGSQRMALSVEGNGPLQKIQAETDAYGSVRATIKEPQCGLPPKDGNYDVANAIGKAGFLHVTKDLGLKEPYRATVQLTSSEVAEDIANYYAVSEQIPTMIALGVTLKSNADVAASGGFLVQAMPGCSEETLKNIETRLGAMPAVSTQLRAGQTPMIILEQLLGEIAFTLQTDYELNFRCNCSRPYVLQMLRGLTQGELDGLAKGDEDTVVTCEYCRKQYQITAEEIDVILQEGQEIKKV
ncbi:MAG: Hsp33 family molecular chaperone [Desulfobacteraceae bacterium 4572_35.1]|nr:MAG: Hsp33 family molecular chaperone [Desulfobacteraceae bacterium 4572_35.1]